MYKLPIIVPHSVAALLIYTVFAQSGILSRVLFHLGLIATPAEMPAFLFDRTGRGIILAYLWKEIPFIAMVVLQRVEKRMQQTGRCGAQSWGRRMADIQICYPTTHRTNACIQLHHYLCILLWGF